MNETTADLGAEVGALLKDMLRLPDAAAGELRRDDIDDWDSVKHAEIIFALEDRYGVRFEEADFDALDSTSAIVARLRARLGT